MANRHAHHRWPFSWSSLFIPATTAMRLLCPRTRSVLRVGNCDIYEGDYDTCAVQLGCPTMQASGHEDTYHCRMRTATGGVEGLFSTGAIKLKPLSLCILHCTRGNDMLNANKWLCREEYKSHRDAAYLIVLAITAQHTRTQTPFRFPRLPPPQARHFQ